MKKFFPKVFFLWKMYFTFVSTTVNQHSINTMTTGGQNTTNSQLEQANTLLKELSVNVTTSDRKAAQVKRNGYSRFTIGTYLKGEGKDLDIALDLLKFFRKRIEDRDRELAA